MTGETTGSEKVSKMVQRDDDDDDARSCIHSLRR